MYITNINAIQHLPFVHDKSSMPLPLLACVTKIQGTEHVLWDSHSNP